LTLNASPPRVEAAVMEVEFLVVVRPTPDGGRSTVTLRPRLATGLPFSPGLMARQVSVIPGRQLDPTYVYESVGKIQVVQIRRVLLLFALVLGLSALVASIAPPPDDRDEAADRPATVVEPPPATAPEPVAPPVKVSAKDTGGPVPTRHVSVGAGFTLQVSVPAAGDVVLEGLGLRQSADQLTPARFDLVAERRGRFPVVFHPIDGDRRVVARLVFEDQQTVTPQQRDR
jgi:hypothetical protein